MNPKFPDSAFINDVVSKLGDVLRQSPAKDIEQNLKAGVTSVLAKFDMVSREEFDVQAAVLARTREKLAQLETRLAQLEQATAQGAASTVSQDPARTED
jgi:BMFP domain-containing protein YqiC